MMTTATRFLSIALLLGGSIVGRAQEPQQSQVPVQPPPTNQQITHDEKQDLKQDQKADKDQAKADKAERKALSTKKQKKADKAQDKANKQAEKAADTPQ